MAPRFDAHSHGPEASALGPGSIRVVCGTRESDWQAVLQPGASPSRVLPMVGLHPWHAAEADPAWESRLAGLLGLHRAGVGECGLDFSRPGDRGLQEGALRIQIRLAHRWGRPLALHAVRAWGPLLAILGEEGVPPAGAMVHGFSGSPDTGRRLQAMGLYLSFSGSLLLPGHVRVWEALKAVAPDRLLLESDGCVDLERVLEAAAGILGLSVEALAARTWENGRRCFQELLA